ncbi:hypothetical protein GCM10027270_33810 [Nocardioides ginkgobilobae]
MAQTISLGPQILPEGGRGTCNQCLQVFVRRAGADGDETEHLLLGSRDHVLSGLLSRLSITPLEYLEDGDRGHRGYEDAQHRPEDVSGAWGPTAPDLSLIDR